MTLKKIGWKKQIPKNSFGLVCVILTKLGFHLNMCHVSDASAQLSSPPPPFPVFSCSVFYQFDLTVSVPRRGVLHLFSQSLRWMTTIKYHNLIRGCSAHWIETDSCFFKTTFMTSRSLMNWIKSCRRNLSYDHSLSRIQCKTSICVCLGQQR